MHCETTTAEAPTEEKKESSEKSSKKKASSSSKKDHHHKKKEDTLKAPESPKKDKKKVESLKAPESPKKDSKKKVESSKAPDSSKKDSKSKKKSRRSSVKHKNHDDDKGEESYDDVYADEDTKKMIILLTEDFWSSTTAETTATALQSLYELLQSDNDNKNDHRVALSLELGAPLLVARKMKDFVVTDTVVQSAALQLLNSSSWTVSATSWYRLLIRVGGLARVQDILTCSTTDLPTETVEEEWQKVQDNALRLLENMASSSAESLDMLMRYRGVETLAQFYGQCHKRKDDVLLPRVSEILYLMTTTTDTDGRDRVVTELSQLLKQDRAETDVVPCHTAVLGLFGKMLENESIAIGLVPVLVRAKAWACIEDILTEGNDLKERSPDIMGLQDKAMGLYEKMAASNPATAELLVENEGVETLKCIVQGKNGELIPRALEILYQLSATTGTDGRSKITEEMGELLRDSRHELLQTAIISLLSEMAQDEETAQGLLQGQGIESLVYTWEMYRADRPAVSDKALDLLVLLSAKGGAACQQAIIDNGFLATIAKTMKDEPANDTIHTRGRQLAQALAAQHGPAVDDTGILTL
mmetsp:Transcript_14466/g.27557  ORF Transcript_14466/g.27557 Transcript_14466/m.27557 type:complete len:587 (+) Transcript_14466:112-1872(+)